MGRRNPPWYVRWLITPPVPGLTRWPGRAADVRSAAGEHAGTSAGTATSTPIMGGQAHGIAAMDRVNSGSAGIATG